MPSARSSTRSSNSWWSKAMGPLMRSGQGGLAPGFQVLGWAVAIIGRAHSQQAVDIILINGQPFGLAVGAFVPMETQPAQGVQDLLDEFFLGALLVRVFDPQDESPPVAPGDEHVEQGGVGPPQMQGAGGAGGKTGAYFGHFNPLRLSGVFTIIFTRRP